MSLDCLYSLIKFRVCVGMLGITLWKSTKGKELQVWYKEAFILSYVIHEVFTPVSKNFEMLETFMSHWVYKTISNRLRGYKRPYHTHSIRSGWAEGMHVSWSVNLLRDRQLFVVFHFIYSFTFSLRNKLVLIILFGCGSSLIRNSNSLIESVCLLAFLMVSQILLIEESLSYFELCLSALYPLITALFYIVSLQCSSLSDVVILLCLRKTSRPPTINFQSVFGACTSFLIPYSFMLINSIPNRLWESALPKLLNDSSILGEGCCVRCAILVEDIFSRWSLHDALLSLLLTISPIPNYFILLFNVIM